MGGVFVDPYQQGKHIDTTNPRVMALLIKSFGLNSGIANIDPNFNQQYSQYISFDKNSNIYNHSQINMYVKMGSTLTKVYPVEI